MKRLLVLALTIFCSSVLARDKCEHTQNVLMRSEQRILIAAEAFAKHHDSQHLLKVTEPLGCILEIHEQASGELKYFANSFLRPILGGPQTPGLALDPRYKIISDELSKISQSGNRQLDQSVMAAFSRGSWGFFTLFCERGDIEFCTTFLPDEKQIQFESPLLAASNMILLRKAYYVLSGKQKEEVAERIKQIYQTTPLEGGLKRKVIEQIYSEIFANPTPLSLLS